MHRILYLLALLILTPSLALAQAPESFYEETRTFHLHPNASGGYALTSDVEVAVTYASERATRERMFFVPEPFYGEVVKLHGELRGKKFGRDRVGVEVPEFQDVFMTGGRVHYIEFPEDIGVGDVARYRYEMSYRDVAYMPVLYVPNVERVKRYEVVVEHPDGVEVDFSVFYPRGNRTPQIDRSDAKRTVLRFEGLEREEPLPYSPFNGFHAAVLTRLSHNGELINPTSEAQFARWYGDLVGSLDGADLSMLAAGLERATPRETVAAIHDHVRSTIRYVADERAENAIVPRAPGVVLGNGYGDCKDRAFLVSALARELGIDVDVVLVSTEPTPEFDYTHVGLYNHVISAYDDGETITYFDPTHRYVPFGDLPESDAGASALLLRAEESRRLRIPPVDTLPHVDIAIEGDLGTPGPAQAHITVRGDYLAEFARLRAEGSGLDIENFLSMATTERLHKIALDRFVLYEETPHSATFTAIADLGEFVVASPTRRYVPQTPFRLVDADVLERASDSHPIYFGGRPHLRLTLDVEAPGFAAAPDSLRLGGVDTEVLTYDARLAEAEAGRTRIEYVFRQSEKRIEGAAKERYLSAASEYLQARSAMFIFRQTPVPTGGQP